MKTIRVVNKITSSAHISSSKSSDNEWIIVYLHNYNKCTKLYIVYQSTKKAQATKNINITVQSQRSLPSTNYLTTKVTVYQTLNNEGYRLPIT